MKKLTILSALALTLVTSSCSESDTNSSKQTQVAVIVNNEEITVHQLNRILQTIGDSQSTDVEGKSVEDQALELLVNQSLILQDAKSQKLERDPAVMQAIEAEKRKIIVDAYIQRNIYMGDDISQADVNTYYNQHPELFSDRKLFIYDAVNIVTSPENKVEVESIVKEAQDLSFLINELVSHNLEYKVVSASKTSENIPLQLLNGLNKLSINDLGFFTLPTGILVINLKQIIAEPINKEQASPVIKNLLFKDKRSSELEQKVNQLKAKATINYLGEFDRLSINNASPVEENVDSPSHIDKGLQGLK